MWWLCLMQSDAVCGGARKGSALVGRAYFKSCFIFVYMVGSATLNP